MGETYEEKIDRLRKIVDNTKKGVLFTGAGISVPSGIPDFRSESGLYSTDYGDYPAEYMLSHDCYTSTPKDFFAFYREKMLYPDAEPNAAHVFFADMEAEGKLSATVTQNIDGLHQAAGAVNVFELHGSVHRNYCMRCGKRFGLDYILSTEGVPHCDECGGRIKPDVVLYGEGLDNDVVEGAIKAIERADTMFVVGTSLSVYPAAGLVRYFGGTNLVMLNKSRTGAESGATLVINDDIESIVYTL